MGCRPWSSLVPLAGVASVQPGGPPTVAQGGSHRPRQDRRGPLLMARCCAKAAFSTCRPPPARCPPAARRPPPAFLLPAVLVLPTILLLPSSHPRPARCPHLFSLAETLPHCHLQVRPACAAGLPLDACGVRVPGDHEAGAGLRDASARFLGEDPAVQRSCLCCGCWGHEEGQGQGMETLNEPKDKDWLCWKIFGFR